MDRKTFSDLENLAHQITGKKQRSVLDFYDEVINLLKGEDFVLAGGFALMAHGISRMTEDVDFVVLSEKSIVSKLEAAGFLAGSDFKLASGKIRIVRYVKDDRILDLMIYQDPQMSRELIKTSEMFNILGHQVPVLSADGIALTKLLAFRLKDQDDLFNLLPKLNEEYLATWVDTLGLDKNRLDQIFKVTHSFLEENYPTVANLLKKI